MRRSSLFDVTAVFNGTRSVVASKFVRLSVALSRQVDGFRLSAVVAFAHFHAFFNATRLANDNPFSPRMFGSSLFNLSAIRAGSVVTSELVLELMRRRGLYNLSAIRASSVVTSKLIR